MRARIGLDATPKERKRALAALFATILTSLIGFGIIIPLLPEYGKSTGANPWEIGWLFASYSLAQLISGPIMGDLSDRYGRRPLLMVSLLGTVLSFVMMARAQTLTMLFLARILDGLSGGNTSLARAYLADITPPEERARSFGLVIGVAFGLGFILGPGLGGLFFKISLAAPAWLAAGLTLVATVLAYFWLPETTHERSQERPSLLASLPLVLAQRSLVYLLLVDFLAWTCMAVYQTSFPLFVDRRFHWTPFEVGMVFMAVGFLGALAQGGAVGRLVKILGERKVLVLGLLVSAASLTLASQTRNPVVFLAAMVPLSFGSAIISPSLLSLISRASGADQQGRIQGIASALEGLGRAVGPVWGNGLLEARGEGAAYLSGGLALFLTAGLATGLREFTSGPQLRQAEPVD